VAELQSGGSRKQPCVPRVASLIRLAVRSGSYQSPNTGPVDNVCTVLRWYAIVGELFGSVELLERWLLVKARFKCVFLLIGLPITLCLLLHFYLPVFPDPDARKCNPNTTDVCHSNATCTPVTPHLCSSTRAVSYRCECNQGYSGDGINCIGELLIFVEQ